MIPAISQLRLFRRAIPSLKPNVLKLSKPRLSHNLEDHFIFPEHVTSMGSPVSMYLVGWTGFILMLLYPLNPMLMTNYRKEGRLLIPYEWECEKLEDSW